MGYNFLAARVAFYLTFILLVIPDESLSEHSGAFRAFVGAINYYHPQIVLAI